MNTRHRHVERSQAALYLLIAMGIAKPALADMRGQTVCTVPPDEAAVITADVGENAWRIWTPAGLSIPTYSSEQGAIGGWDPSFVCDVRIQYDLREIPARFHRLNRNLAKYEENEGGVIAGEVDVRILIVGQSALAQAVEPPESTQPSPVAASTAPPADGASELPPEISAADTCEGKSIGSQCWMQASNLPGCYVWNGELGRNGSVRWSGNCHEGLAEGIGDLRWAWEDDQGEPNSSSSNGRMAGGKREGPWVIRFANGVVEEGPYVNGERNGHWVSRLDGLDGGVQEGPFVDGEQHGHWVLRFADGGIQEGPYVDGEWNGQWVLRFADGQVEEGPFVEGERHGRWVLRLADGGVQEGPYVDGERHGYWVLRYADGGVEEGPFVDGEKNGQWVVRGSDGTIGFIETWEDGVLSNTTVLP